jgi:hypothetical protein
VCVIKRHLSLFLLGHVETAVVVPFHRLSHSGSRSYYHAIAGVDFGMTHPNAFVSGVLCWLRYSNFCPDVTNGTVDELLTLANQASCNTISDQENLQYCKLRLELGDLSVLSIKCRMMCHAGSSEVKVIDGGVEVIDDFWVAGTGRRSNACSHPRWLPLPDCSFTTEGKSRHEKNAHDFLPLGQPFYH